MPASNRPARDSSGRGPSGRDSMLDRGLQVLQAFRPTGRPLTLSAVARRTGLPRSTTHRLLDALRTQGMVEHTADGWVLGRALFELGELVPIKVTLREAALPFMQDLYEATHETVHLGVGDGVDVLYVERIHGHAGIDLPSRIGGRLPLSSTGLGKTLLAFSPSGLVDEVIARPLRRLTGHSITDPDVLLAELAEIRRAGVGYDREEAVAGVACVAAPVFTRGQLVAALSVTVPAARFRLERLTPAVQTAALALSRRLAR